MKNIKIWVKVSVIIKVFGDFFIRNIYVIMKSVICRLKGSM